MRSGDRDRVDPNVDPRLADDLDQFGMVKGLLSAIVITALAGAAALLVAGVLL